MHVPAEKAERFACHGAERRERDFQRDVSRIKLALGTFSLPERAH